MATFTKSILSGSTDGRGIKVAAIATPGTTIHTGSSTAATLHRITLYATNQDTTGRSVTIEWGGTTSPDDTITYNLAPTSGLVLIAPALLIKGNATPLVVKAFASSANVVVIHGEVDVIA
jgi:hypothetical protein